MIKIPGKGRAWYQKALRYLTKYMFKTKKNDWTWAASNLCSYSSKAMIYYFLQHWRVKSVKHDMPQTCIVHSHYGTVPSSYNCTHVCEFLHGGHVYLQS